MFGSQVSFNLDKKTRYKSYLGAVVSIISVFLIMSLCYKGSYTKDYQEWFDLKYVSLLKDKWL